MQTEKRQVTTIQLYKLKDTQRWKKLTKQQNFETEKLAQKICAKNAQNCEKYQKWPKLHKKGKKPLKNA